MNSQDDIWKLEELRGWCEEDWVRCARVWREDVYEFARFFFPHVLSCEVPGFHREVYGILPKVNYLAVEAFRGGAKSTIGLIIYPLWRALWGKVGDISLISRSESFILNEVSRKIRMELEMNQRIRLFFGDMKTDKWSESYFTLANGISIEGKGIDGQLRGGRRGLIVLDDLEDNESVRSEEQRDKLKKRISKEILPKLLPQGQLLYFGTPIHTLCYLHQLIKTPDNGWEKRVFDAYRDGTEEKGHEAWPEMLDHDELQKRKEIMGSTYFSAEYRCNPLMDESMPIKEEHIRYWTDLPTQYSCVITVDPAYSEDVSADYKVATLVAIDQHSNRYLLSYIRTHDSLNDFMNAVLNLWMQYKPFITALGIPNSGTEKSFFSGFMKFCEEKKVYPPVAELKNSFTQAQTRLSIRNKTARITAALQPLFEQGKYYIRSEHLEARDELLTVGMSRWDDITDCMAYAEQLLQPVFFDVTGDEHTDYSQAPMMANYGT